MKKPTPINITYIPADSLIDEEIANAIRPFVSKLRAAALEDEKLTKHRDEANPDIAAETFDKTYAQAVAGDSSAERRIYDLGPKEFLVERQRQIYDLREQTRVNAALKNIDLFNAASAAAIPAVERGAEKAQAQHRSVLRAMGEPEKDSELIAKNAGWRTHYLQDLGENCRYGEGARALLDRVGFTNVVLGENAQ